MSWHRNKVSLNIHKGYRCRSLITYWSRSKATSNINNSFSCISVGEIAQLVSVCCLSLIYYTFEWLHFASGSAHGKMCINKVRVHRRAHGQTHTKLLELRQISAYLPVQELSWLFCPVPTLLCMPRTGKDLCVVYATGGRKGKLDTKKD